MDSIWTKTASLPRKPPLEGNHHTRALIIGGGMAGILCAHTLTQAGVDCILVEAKRICSGTTKNTTAKVTAQHGLIYHKLLRRFGLEITRSYLHANLDALAAMRALCVGMDCDWEEKSSFIYSRTDDSNLDAELKALNLLGYPAQFSTAPALPFPVAGAVEFPAQAQFHPLKFAAALTPELPIFEDTKVLELMPGRAVTNRGTITAEHILVATHFPMLNKHGGYFLKLYQHRSYVLAVEGAADVDGMYLDASEQGLSLRNYGPFLLVGGGSHRTGKVGSGWQTLTSFARKYYPDAKEAARWAAQDCMSLDKMPYIGAYSHRTSGLYVATGFNKWGMTGSMAAAQLLTDLVLGRKNPYADIFSPSRSILHPQLGANAAHALLGLITPSAPRCPHLGCVLKYNRQEHSWDCPCHGSRFDKEGQLIDGPATDDKTL